MLGAQFECFLVVGDGSSRHTFFLAFLAQQSVFCCQAFQEFLLFLFLFLLLPDDFAQLLVLSYQGVDLSQFSSYQSFGTWLLDVVSAVYGKEEVIECSLHVALVECCGGIMVLFVGFALGKSRVDGRLVVVVTGKLLHLVAYKDLVLSDGFLQLMPSRLVQRDSAT